MESGYTVKIVPEDERLSLDILSIFEIAQILSHRITQINKDSRTFLPPEFRYINTNTLDNATKAKIPKDYIVNNGDGSFVKLSTTEDIVYGEINTGNIPYCISRHISTDHNKKIIWVELVNPNSLAKPILEYLSNHS